mmetsp:Transcript_18268/g.39481  ORF Transcript_18268/g.39481 Transcript_18268/m.39481 type:complete len:201 (-) Transcript_18268:1133-1735(-)
MSFSSPSSSSCTLVPTINPSSLSAPSTSSSIVKPLVPPLPLKPLTLLNPLVLPPILGQRKLSPPLTPLTPPPLLCLTVNRTSSTARATSSAACRGSLTGVPFTAMTSAPSIPSPLCRCRRKMLSGRMREITAISGCSGDRRVNTMPTLALGRLKAVSVDMDDNSPPLLSRRCKLVRWKDEVSLTLVAKLLVFKVWSVLLL